MNQFCTDSKNDFHKKKSKIRATGFVLTRVTAICIYNVFYLVLMFYVNALSENNYADYLYRRIGQNLTKHRIIGREKP